MRKNVKVFINLFKREMFPLANMSELSNPRDPFCVAHCYGYSSWKPSNTYPQAMWKTLKQAVIWNNVREFLLKKSNLHK